MVWPKNSFAFFEYPSSAPLGHVDPGCGNWPLRMDGSWTRLAWQHGEGRTCLGMARLVSDVPKQGCSVTFEKTQRKIGE